MGKIVEYKATENPCTFTGANKPLASGLGSPVIRNFENNPVGAGFFNNLKTISG